MATALEHSLSNQHPPALEDQRTMTWTAPRVVEIAVGLEINSYASAERN